MLRNIFSIEVFAEGARSGGGGTGRVRTYNSTTGRTGTRTIRRPTTTVQQQAQRSRNAATRNALQALGVR